MLFRFRFPPRFCAAGTWVDFDAVAGHAAAAAICSGRADACERKAHGAVAEAVGQRLHQTAKV
eukprot:2894398-Rhodomonas_salina.2